MLLDHREYTACSKEAATNGEIPLIVISAQNHWRLCFPENCLEFGQPSFDWFRMHAPQRDGSRKRRKAAKAFKIPRSYSVLNSPEQARCRLDNMKENNEHAKLYLAKLRIGFGSKPCPPAGAKGLE